MSRRKPSPFAGITNREEFIEALQQQLGNLSVTDLNAAKLLCKLKGWGNPPSETSEASVVEVESSPTVAAPISTADGMWRWREDSKSPWSPSLTAEQMAETYNRIDAESLAAHAAVVAAAIAASNNPAGWVTVGNSPQQHIEVRVITPKGFQQWLSCESCTVEVLDALNAEPDHQTVDHW